MKEQSRTASWNAKWAVKKRFFISERHKKKESWKLKAAGGAGSSKEKISDNVWKYGITIEYGIFNLAGWEPLLL
jgi:hypothetical protein